MDNKTITAFPEEENTNNTKQEMIPTFVFDLEVILPNGTTGKVSGVSAGDLYEGPTKNASLKDLMENGIPLESIKAENGEQALSNKEIANTYEKSIPCFVDMNYINQADISPTIERLLNGNTGNEVLINTAKAAPQLPVPRKIERILPTISKIELPAKGIVPPDNVTDNPYILEDRDNSAIFERVSRRIAGFYRVKFFEGNHYYYNHTLRYFEVLKDNDLRILIDMDPEVQRIRFKNTDIHYTIARLIKNDSTLKVDRSLIIDTNPDKWIFKNCIIDIREGTSLDNDGSVFFYRHALAANYDPSAECPIFKAFIKSVANNSAEIEILLWQVIGYLLSTDTRAKKFFLFFGERDCGKSLLGDVISDLIGRGSVSNLSPHNFADRFASSETVDKLLLTCMDMPDAEISNKAIGLLKQITGRDSIYSERKNKDAVSTPPVSKILLGSNFPLKLSASDEALMARLITVPFTHRIRPEEQDHQLKDKLLQEASGICNTAMAYYRDLINNNYAFQPLYVNMPVSVIDSSALLKDFIEQNIIFTGSYNDLIAVEELFTLFKLFCAKKGVYNPLSKEAFSKKFRMLHDYDTSQYPDNTIPAGCVWKGKIKINGNSVQGFRGIRISNDVSIK